ncbi:RloB family protein [Paraburkholderia sp. BCC1885]|uniref:RloB family protein n=1 Tax=Paraburkholderia sp. BCC1885 TaxID=2562669 RepID=UPI001182FE5C|nr:RloB family protein [Paraburkholderia sp. BCC1885]
MGSDNLFHKRKAQRASSFVRQKREKPQKPRYLIVCEGSATEPNYFNGLRNIERLPTAHVKVCGEECGSDPLSVVQYALQLYEDEEFDRFDKVFCVIDRDGHTTFKPAVALVKDVHEKGTPIELVVSWPCFEYWVLLHHQYRRSPYYPTRGRSSCDAVGSEIRRNHDRNYSKGADDLYAMLRSKQEGALENAATALADAEATGEKNPSTQVHLLVEALLALKLP